MQLNWVPRNYDHRLAVRVHLQPRNLDLRMDLSCIEDESPNKCYRWNMHLHLTHGLAIDSEWSHDTNQNEYKMDCSWSMNKWEQEQGNSIWRISSSISTLQWLNEVIHIIDASSMNWQLWWGCGFFIKGAIIWETPNLHLMRNSNKC